ncbi:MAG: hypothetical protein D3923_05640 [Candidatus Electrothrix sp. AR3]|nr:hypothetical protein [Candidatus Electrothrix sp. AR3]
MLLKYVILISCVFILGSFVVQVFHKHKQPENPSRLLGRSTRMGGGLLYDYMRPKVGQKKIAVLDGLDQ